MTQAITMTPDLKNDLDSVFGNAELKMTDDLKQDLDSTFNKSKESKINQMLSATLPDVGQTIGGLAFTHLGPVGSAVGGVVGREAGIVGKHANAGTPTYAGGITGYSGAVTDFLMKSTEQKRKSLLDEVIDDTPKTIAVEGLLAGLGVGLKAVGGRLLKGTIGEKVGKSILSGRGNNIVKAENFAEVLPQNIVDDVANYSGKVTGFLGSNVEQTLKAPDIAGKKIIFPDEKTVLRSIGSRGYTKLSDALQDLSSFLKPTEQKGLERISTVITKYGGREIKPHQMWQIRRALDKVGNNMSFTDEGWRVFKGVRDSLNNPLRRLSPSVAGAFDRYASAMDTIKQYGRYFKTIRDVSGAKQTVNLESLAQKISNEVGGKELFKNLKALDMSIPENMRIVDKLLDYGLSQKLLDMSSSITRNYTKTGVVGNLLGGKRNIANIANFLNAPATNVAKQLMGRGIATGGRRIIT
jgi:hypothetical protein